VGPDAVPIPDNLAPMPYLLAGPLVALIGIAAVFFVLRRKSVEKRSMYSARRLQIEHKVRAARQRTLAPHGHVEKAPEPAPAASAFEQPKIQPTVTYEASPYQAPPVAPPPPVQPQKAPEPPPWEQPSIPAAAQTQAPAPAPASSGWDFPPAAKPEPYAPAAPPEPFRPAPEPTPMPAPSEPVWTPAPRPAEPLPPAEKVAPAASVAPASSSTAAGGWSIVTTTKDSSVSVEDAPKKKGKHKEQAQTSDWQLASGEEPSMAIEEAVSGPSTGKTAMAVAQYAVLVVGLVMVLIGVLVMVANSHVT
jgi:hypothetical protein